MSAQRTLSDTVPTGHSVLIKLLHMTVNAAIGLLTFRSDFVCKIPTTRLLGWSGNVLEHNIGIETKHGNFY